MSFLERFSQQRKPIEASTSPQGIRIEKHFLPEPLAPRASLHNLSQISEVASIRQTGTEVLYPDSGVSYTFSPPDQSDKYTNNLDRCITVILAGKTPKTQDEMSALLHISPFFLVDERAQDSLSVLLEQFKEITAKGAPKAIIAGGLVIRGGYTNLSYKEEYQTLISNVQANLKETLDTTAVVVNPKRKNPHNLTHIYYETSTQTAHIIESGAASRREKRPQIPPTVLGDGERSPLRLGQQRRQHTVYVWDDLVMNSPSVSVEEPPRIVEDIPLEENNKQIIWDEFEGPEKGKTL